jgi:hypothetical protein
MPQEPAAEAEAQCLRGLRFELQGGIVQAQLVQGLAQVVEILRADREQAGKDPWLDLLEARERTFRRLLGVGEGVADLGTGDVLDAGNDVADLTNLQERLVQRLRREHAHAVHLIGAAHRHRNDPALGMQASGLDPHQRHHTEVVVVPGVDDQRLQRRIGGPFRRRDPPHQFLQQVRNALSGLGRDPDGVRGLDPDHVLDLGRDPVGVGGRQVDLVQHRHHFEALVDCGVAIRHALGLDALRGVDHQQGPLTGGEGARHLVGEVDMTGGIDEVQLVALTVRSVIVQRHALCLDGDPPLPFQVHGVEHLLGHLTLGQATADLDQPVGKRGFPVVDVRDDGEVAGQSGLSHSGSARRSGPTYRGNGSRGSRRPPRGRGPWH